MLFSAVEVGEERPVLVLTAPSGFEDAPCQVTATMPEGREIFLPTRRVPGGYEALFCPVQTGPHKVHVDIVGREIPKSPVLVNVESKLDIKKLQVKGLEKRKLEAVLCFICLHLSSIIHTLHFVHLFCR